MSSETLSPRREDELAIRDLAFRYARIVDRRVYDEIPQVFLPDCVLTGVGFRMKGHAELDAGLRKIEMYSVTQHCVHNQATRIDGDQASGEFYCVAAHIHERDGVPYKLDMGIRYEDRYARTTDGWRIAERTLVLLWQQDLPLDLSVAALSRPAPARGGAARAAARGARARAASPRAKSAAARAGGKQGGAKKAGAKKTGAKKASARKTGGGTRKRAR
ncbi:MAG: nuclear transport factor 2 family protein [Myxococcota bacterium]